MPIVISSIAPESVLENDLIPTSAVVGNIHDDISKDSGTNRGTVVLVEHVAKFTLRGEARWILWMGVPLVLAFVNESVTI